MLNLLRPSTFPILLLSCVSAAQVVTIGAPGDRFAPFDAVQTSRSQFTMFLIGSHDPHSTDLQTPSGSVSRLDLKAPGKARHEYEEGYHLLMRNDLSAAAEHLKKAVAIYPQFVAAHNALGTAYLNRGQNDLAHGQFAEAVALDDHLPNSYLNLGCVDLALKLYPEAEKALHKASAMAPLDVQLQSALVYGEFMNHDYPAVLETSRAVHAGKHEGASTIHFFAAAAWQMQGNLPQAEHELKTLLEEDPKSGSAGQAGKILDQIKAEEARRAEVKLHPAAAQRVSRVPDGPSQEELARQRQIAQQQDKERSQIAEAEASPDPTCLDCVAGNPASDPASGPATSDDTQGATFRLSADEVSVFFAATDRGKSVTDLAAADVEIRDDSEPPGAILGFRNESGLPLRLGLVVDTSESVTGRFSFEQAAAARFLQDVVVDREDLAFVVGVNNSVLLEQDFTRDLELTAHAVNQLAPGGGTALWDAVAFAAGKLAGHPETGPVARILVVISDGEDNSSSQTLKQAVAAAQRGEVAVYTVSSRDELRQDRGALLGDQALRTISELTGGAAFAPGSVRGLGRSLADVQQVIRGRYMISYKPASFQRDDRYRTIDIEAQKEGRKLTVFARKGYYASPGAPITTAP